MIAVLVRDEQGVHQRFLTGAAPYKYQSKVDQNGRKIGKNQNEFLHVLEFLRQNLNRLKVLVNFHFASRPFHNFAPLKDKQFWRRVIRRNDTFSVL